MRRLLVASAILASALAMPLGLAAATPAPHPALLATDSDGATSALGYLLAAQKSNGSLDGSIGETADFVIGAAAAGFDPSTLTGCSGTTSALSYLAGASDAAAGDAAKTGKTILAVVAAGGNPAGFAGRDLVARLAALYDSTSGAYGNGATFGQSFAILATAASGGSVPAKAAAALAALQDPDGSWSYGTAPVAAGGGDSNSTAIALMALDAAGVHSADSTALAYLHTQQLADGGFMYSSALGPPADPDSDAIVLEVLLAAGQDPQAAGWSQGSNNALTNLRAAQGADGGFLYPGNAGEDAFTTSQVPAAFMRIPYAALVSFKSGKSIPTTGCASAGASQSASASRNTTPPPTSAGSGPSQSGGSTPVLAALTCLVLGALGLAAVLASHRRGIRRPAEAARER